MKINRLLLRMAVGLTGVASGCVPIVDSISDMKRDCESVGGVWEIYRDVDGNYGGEGCRLEGGYEGSGFEIESRTECEVVNGVWRMWSRLDYALDKESCNIRTSDSGKRCYSSSNCEGECFAVGKSEGECSGFRREYGCFATIEDGKLYEICAD